MINRELAQKVDHIQESVDWLVNFTKDINPRLNWLEEYAELLPASLTVIEDLKIENRQLRQRQYNTAVLYGPIASINEAANPPIVKVQNGADEHEIVVPHPLFDSANLQIGEVIRVEAKVRNHKTPGRGAYSNFHATGIEKINFGTVDQNLEAGYNGK